jgi:rRNA maturation protein Rpf1
MAKPGLQSTPNFVLSQMISERCPKLVYSQLSPFQEQKGKPQYLVFIQKPLILRR